MNHESHVDRRGFMKTGTVATAAAGLSLAVSESSADEKRVSKKIRVGVIESVKRSQKEGRRIELRSTFDWPVST